MKPNLKERVKDRQLIDSAIRAEKIWQESEIVDYGGGSSYDPNEEWLLKYEVNDKGVGRILLPPSLSILLESDRISIRPYAGGLFIRSV